ncbi:MAG: FtsX-like permease family protein [Microscillaceae bacterium]|nr:FtsX-like permease family protein [Microscillaceae bacterium]
MLKNYFKIACRNLLRNRDFTLINIFGLAIGINACLIVYLWTSYEMSFDTFHPDRQRIYRVVTDIDNAGEIWKFAGVVDPLGPTMQKELTGLEAIAPFNLMNIDKVWIGNPFNPARKEDLWKEFKQESTKNGDFIAADASFFEVFKHPWLMGNPHIALKEPFQVVLTVQKAKKYFGNIPLDKMIGRVLTYVTSEDTITLKVSGIVEAWKQNSDFKFQDCISLATLYKMKNGENMKSWNGINSNSQLVVKLNKGTSPQQIQAQFPALFKKYDSEYVPRLQALFDVHFDADYSGHIRTAHKPTLYGLMAISGFLLIIAAINFINLTTAQSAQRAKEIGIRKVIGSTRRNLIIQFLCEALVLTTLAGILSLLTIEPVLWLFSDFVSEGVKNQLFTLEIGLFLIAMIGVTSLLSGFYPAWVLSSLLPVASLKNQTSQRGSRKSNLRKVLIVFQFTFAQVFIIGTIVVSAQIRYMLHKDLGFKKDAVITVATPWNDPLNRKKVLMEKLKQFPEVKMTSFSSSTPLGNSFASYTLEYKETGKKPIETNVFHKPGDENYIKLYEIKLLAGRNVRDSDTIREVMINETYVRTLGFRQPERAIGQFLWSGNRKFPIVGVVADFNIQPLHYQIRPMMIASENQYSYLINLKLHTKGKQTPDFQALISKIEKAYLSVFPETTFKYEFFEDELARMYNKEQKIAHLLSIATGIVIFISCIGLFGLVTYTVQQRTKEIGIRKVLGATIRQITVLLSYDFLKLVLISILIGSPIAYYFAQEWLHDFAYRMNPSWLIFVGAAFISILITLATVSIRAVRAAMRNPVESLRYE